MNDAQPRTNDPESHRIHAKVGNIVRVPMALYVNALLVWEGEADVYLGLDAAGRLTNYLSLEGKVRTPLRGVTHWNSPALGDDGPWRFAQGGAYDITDPQRTPTVVMRCEMYQRA